MDNKKRIMLAGAAIALYFMYKKSKTPSCNGSFFLVNGAKVCETDLEALGYYYWLNAPAPKVSGYYNLSDFPNSFQMETTLWENLLKDSFLLIQDVSSPLYNNAHNILRQFVSPGVSALQIAP